MLSYAYISSAPILTGSDSGFYHLLGVLAILFGVLCLLVLAILATPRYRRAMVQAGQVHPRDWTLQSWEDRKPGDPFDKSWKDEQAAFTDQVMRAEPDTLTDTLIPGVTPVALPPDTGRPTVTVKPLVGVVVDQIPDQHIDGGQLVLEEIRRSNKEFLASLDSM